jgi:N-acetylmuramoyl-L-alanine amidase-like protein
LPLKFLAQKFIELRAHRIHDPVARLRYLQRRIGMARPAPMRRNRGPILLFLLLLASLLIAYKPSKTEAQQSFAPLPRITAAGADVFANVWLVDHTKEFEIYSNGLRIDDRYTVSSDSRASYQVYRRSAIDPAQPEWRTAPAGIVYHTTESDQARFEEDETSKLKRIGKGVLSYVQQHHAYHFLIDRFGQVFRVVKESDIADHAGMSIWADNQVVYVNLNSSFFGVAFETQTQSGGELPSANPAQIHAARVLTEMLRGKYHLPASNCVTHAQVSVNPGNMLIGYHTDWAGNFPFLEVGLSDNYTAPPPSIYAFGFDYDATFVHHTGVRLWEGLALADDEMRTEAAARGLAVAKYRTILRKKYKEILETLKTASNSKEKSNATS